MRTLIANLTEIMVISVVRVSKLVQFTLKTRYFSAFSGYLAKNYQYIA